MKLIIYRIWIIITRVFLILGTMTCSHWNFVSKHKNTNEEFKPYIEHFEKLTNRKVKINLGFEDLYGSTVGICYYRVRGNEISINKESWKNYNKDERQILINHELSHCICLTRHTTIEDSYGCQLNYMGATMPNPTCLIKYRSEYEQQLIKDCIVN